MRPAHESSLGQFALDVLMGKDSKACLLADQLRRKQQEINVMRQADDDTKARFMNQHGLTMTQYGMIYDQLLSWGFESLHVDILCFHTFHSLPSRDKRLNLIETCMGRLSAAPYELSANQIFQLVMSNLLSVERTAYQIQEFIKLADLALALGQNIDSLFISACQPCWRSPPTSVFFVPHKSKKLSSRYPCGEGSVQKRPKLESDESATVVTSTFNC